MSFIKLLRVLVLGAALLLAAPAWATSPTVAATNGGSQATDVTSHTINLPTGISSGNLLLVFFTVRNLPAVTAPSGWTELFTVSVGATLKTVAFYRRADGSEGSTITITTDAAKMSAHTSYRITGDDTGAVPQASTASDSSGTSSDANPPNHSVSWNTTDTLWLAMCGYFGGTAVVTYPASYSNGINFNNGSTVGVGTGAAERQLKASSEDPGVFPIKIGGSPYNTEWAAATIAIRGSGWSTGGATCANQDEASSSATLACTVSTENLEAGNVAVVACAGDNVSGSGNTNDHGVVTDSAGNTYTKAYEFTEGTGGAAAGATTSVHYSKLTTQLTSGSGTITCNYTTSVTDRAMHLVREFTIDTGNVVSVEGGPQGEESNGGDAGSLTISGLTSGEYLFVRGIATESNAATSMTATTNYSLPANPSDGCNNTTAGGEASDMGACSEYRIFTGTGDTSNPTLVDTSNDNASVFVALKQAAPPQAGPCPKTLLLLGVGCS